MESVNKKDLEWKFDVDYTQVSFSKELIGLILMLHIIPNLNSKLDDKEKKFVEACYNGFGFKKNCDWAKVIKTHKENRKLSLTANIYNISAYEFEKIPFKKLSEIMDKNNFTWTKIFTMIKKLDSYCYIWFADKFFDFQDVKQDLKEKLKSESGKVFDLFKKDWKKDRQTTMINNRKNWIKKVKLEEKKIIKSREDLKEIFTKIRECLDDGLFLYSNEEKIIRYELVYDYQGVFHFLWKYRDDENYSNMGNRKLVLKLLADLGFSFDYEKFIGNENTFGEEIKAESTSSNYSEKCILEQFKKLVQNFNKYRDLSECILWFDDKNKKIDIGMLCFWSDWNDKICPIDKEYNRGFSEEDMSCVLDKFKNEKKGFCCAENMQFFVYMMENPYKPEYQIMKDEEKREQFYLDLMDVIVKSVGVHSIPIDQIFNCKERDFTKQEEEDFIKKNNLQGIEGKTITTLTFACYTKKGDKCYWKNEKKQKLLLNKIEYAGYFWDIITRIPKDVLNKKGIKKKIKETLQKILGHTGPATVEQKNVISLMLFVYEHFDLDLSKEDISKLCQEVEIICSLYNNSESFWLNDMFRIIFKNRDKFSLDEKKKLLDGVMKVKKLFGWSFSKHEKELKDSNSGLNQKINRIQRVFRGYKQREKLPKQINRDALKLYMEKLLDERKLKNTLKIQKVFRVFSYRKKLKQKQLNEIKEKTARLKIKRNAKAFLIRKRKMTKNCKWLFVGFVISLVAFLFEIFVFDVAFLSILSISTLLVAIILIARFLYIDHKFKIFFWKRKPPIENIIDPSIQKENLIFNDKNNLITNRQIGAVLLNQNSITDDLIGTSIKNQSSNPKPREEKNIEEGNIIDTTENRSNQINLNEKNI